MTTEIPDAMGIISKDFLDLTNYLSDGNETDQGCSSGNVYDLLFSMLSDKNISKCQNFVEPAYPIAYQYGRTFYAYATPIILIIGILGNSLSLNVFLSRNMRGMSASAYLAALSATDLSSLLFYVTVEWLKRGLVYIYPLLKISFLENNGICQILLYLSYVSRFLSSWLLVAFTFERYIGVCHPLLRRRVCTKRTTRRIIASICFLACVLVFYKPILSGVYKSPDGTKYCTSDKKFDFPSFVLDSMFAVSITIVPFVLVITINTLIVHRLCKTNRRQQQSTARKSGIKLRLGNIIRTEESIIKLEFTLILLTVSFFFIAFNIPYMSIWCRNFIYNRYISEQQTLSVENIEYWQGVLYVTRTIFYMNYCINFFLYSITGTYFRKEVKYLFALKSRQDRYEYTGSSYNKMRISWV